MEPGAFFGLINLQKLHLDNNALSTLTWEVFNPVDYVDTGGHPPVVTLSLGGNPLQCESNLCWLKQGKRDGWIKSFTRDDRDMAGEPECRNMPNVSLGRVSLRCPHSGK